MNSIYLEILQELSEDDVKILCKNIDINILIEPIKLNGKQYAKYASQLGRMDKKSLLVQKNLPRIAYELYIKNDINYLKLLAAEAKKLKEIFLSMLKECMGDIKPEQIYNFTIEEYLQLFKYIINTPGTSFNVDLFILQAKINNIKINESIKKQIDIAWYYTNEIENIKKDLNNIYEQKLKSKLDESYKEMIFIRDGLNKKIKDIQNDENELKKDISSKQQTIIMLMSDNEKEVNLSKELQKNIVDKEKEIRGLNEQIKDLGIVIENLTYQIQDNKNEAYSKLELKWQEENIDKITECNDLKCHIALYNDEIFELEKKKNELISSISEWNENIETYFSHIDQKIIEHKVNSILFNNSFNNKQIAVTKEYEVGIDRLYIQRGYLAQNYNKCKIYDDYIEVVEINLANIGEKNSNKDIIDFFNTAINVGLYPLICGYGAREVAMALIASRYAEKPSIICVPTGYDNVNELVDKIDRADTRSIIIEDIFGKMNEGIILPILRGSCDKVIVFTAESIEDLTYLQKYYYNYLQLIVIDRRSNIKANHVVYSDAEEVFSRKIYTGKESGHKLSRKIMGEIGIQLSYVLTRGNIICELMDYYTDKSEEDILIKLYNTELKWLLNEENKEKLIKILEANQEKYLKLLECMG